MGSPYWFQLKMESDRSWEPHFLGDLPRLDPTQRLDPDAMAAFSWFEEDGVLHIPFDTIPRLVKLHPGE